MIEADEGKPERKPEWGGDWETQVGCVRRVLLGYL